MTDEKQEKQRGCKPHVRYEKRIMFERGSSQLSYQMWIFEDYVKERLKALGVLQ